ncbi:MAG: DUF308 domain-containing protein [Eubacteriaceae bacterium]|jgi:uncharacterized membrane protein HdeD (DUF308 family)|nr:DUF308 domain-containing protein [Eubacteriaceae bacterium]
MNIAKGFKTYAVLIGIVMLVLGAVCLFRPQVMESLIIWIMGAVVIVTGVVYIFQAKSAAAAGDGSTGRMISGILLVILGVVMIMCQVITKTAIGVGIAVMAFALGINRLIAASSVKKSAGNNKPAFISGVLHLVFACLMIFATFKMLDLIMVFIGVYLLFAGLTITLAAAMFKDI